MRIAHQFVIALTAAATLMMAADLAVTGTWEGRFHDQPAVRLTIKDGGRLSGAMVFYVFRDEGAGPKIVGEQTVELVNPKLVGKNLSFEVRNPAADGLIGFKMDVRGDNEAVLGAPDGRAVKMIRVK